jgi:hypothetical protein
LVIPHPEDLGDIRPDGSLEPENYWKAKILDIRAETEDAEVVSFFPCTAILDV